MIGRARRGMVKVAPNNDNKNNEGLADVATEQMRDIAEKLKVHKDDTGKFPSRWATSRTSWPAVRSPTIHGTALSRMNSQTPATLTCLGSDGEPGGEGHAADIAWTQEGKQESAPPEGEPEPKPEPEPAD